MAAIEGKILVTTEELSNAADVLTSKMTTVTECFQKMESTMSASSSYWVGTAGDAHRQLYTEQKGTIENIISLYQEHISDLKEMAGIYSQAEEAAEAQAEELPTLNL